MLDRAGNRVHGLLQEASYETKKALHPFLVSATGVIFLGFVEWVMHGAVPWFFIAALVLIIALNMRNTRFCRNVTQRSGRRSRDRTSAQSAAPTCEASWFWRAHAKAAFR